MIRSLRGIAFNYIPFIEQEISAAMQSNDPKLDYCDEIIAVGRKNLISLLKLQGNKKMLKRVRSNRHEFYLLLLNHSGMTLKMVSLPFWEPANQIDQAA